MTYIYIMTLSGNDIQHYDTPRNDTQHNGNQPTTFSMMILSIMTLRKTIKMRLSKCWLVQLSP
jgi:hypothetical protein